MTSETAGIYRIWTFLLYIFFTLHADAQYCPAGKHWVRAFFRHSYYRSDGTFVNASNVTSHCQNNPDSYDFWQTKIKSGRPEGWPHTEEVAKNWTEEERERVFEALSDLPDQLKLRALNSIFRMAKSHTKAGNPSSSAEGMIILYDEAFSKDYKLGQILAHELSHQVYRDLSKDEKQDYRMVTNWFGYEGENGQVKRAQRKDEYVAEDGRESPEEDFSNNVEYYLFDPKKLQKVTPHAYRWIRDHFGDKFKLRGIPK